MCGSIPSLTRVALGASDATKLVVCGAANEVGEGGGGCVELIRVENKEKNKIKRRFFD